MTFATGLPLAAVEAVVEVSAIDAPRTRRPALPAVDDAWGVEYVRLGDGARGGLNETYADIGHGADDASNTSVPDGLRHFKFRDCVSAAGRDRAGSANLNSPMKVDTTPKGEDIARENWSKHEQKTPPHALSGIQGQGGAGRRSRRQDAGRVGAAA